MKRNGKFYANMIERLNQAGVDFGMNQYYAVYLINGDSMLGKKYKPLLLKFVNYICDLVEDAKSYPAEMFDMRSYIDYTEDYTDFGVYITNEEGDVIFDFTGTVDGEHPHHWEAFKAFLSQFNGWLHANH